MEKTQFYIGDDEDYCLDETNFQKGSKTKRQPLEGGRDKDFLWLLRNLIPNPENPKEKMIKGCQIIFPDTVFFLKDGRIDCLV